MSVVLADWTGPCLQVFDPVGPVLSCGTRPHITPSSQITALDQAFIREWFFDPMGRAMVIDVVPGPASLLLLGLGLSALGLVARRRRRR